MVSILIPNYNHARYLPQRIESVLQQSYTDTEIIILDDCSPDGSRVIIEHYAALDSRIRVVYNEQNSGSTFKQWNKGFALARGKYIWIAESDDYAAPKLLETLVGQLDEGPDIGLAYCNSVIVDESNKELSLFENFYPELHPTLWTKDFVLEGKYLITEFMSYRNIIPNASAVVVRKSAIDATGRADESFRVNGDWIFWSSIIADTKVAFVAEKLNFFRVHTNNVRSKTVSNGVALKEMTKVVCAMQQYGKPNQLLLERMIGSLTREWFDRVIRAGTPMRTHVEIFNNLKKIDKAFATRFARYAAGRLVKSPIVAMKRFLNAGPARSAAGKDE